MKTEELPSLPRNPLYQFDFKKIEDDINTVYARLKNAELNGDLQGYNLGLAEFYQLMTDMMFGILTVDPPEYFVKHDIDVYEEACSFGLIVLDRIRTKKIDWDPKIRQAWTWYAKISSKWFHYSYPQEKSLDISLERLLEEMAPVLLDASSENLPFPHVQMYDQDSILYHELVEKVMFILKLHYEESEITRMLPLTLFSIQFNVELSKEICKFKSLFLVTLKRLFSMYVEPNRLIPMNLDKEVDKNIVTLILLIYLSSQDNTTIPLELVSSLDFFSIFRLAIFSGGQTLYIPTVEELETVVTSAVALTTMLTEGVDSKSSRRLAKQFMGYGYDIRRLNIFIKSMVDNLSSSDSLMVKFLSTNCENSFFYDLLKNLKHVSDCQTKIINDLDGKIHSSSPEELVKYLGDLDDSERKLVTFVERLIKMKTTGVKI